MRRRMMVVGVVALMLGSAALAQGMREARRSTLAMLNRAIPDVRITDVVLEDALEFLCEAAQVTIVPRWGVLEAAGVTRETEVTVRVRNLRLGQILGMILNEAGGPDVKLAYRASGDLIIVSTEADLGQELFIRVYDIRDLVLRIPRFSAANSLDPTAGLSNGSGGNSGIYTPSPENEPSAGAEEDVDAAAAELVALIRDTVDPDSWREYGGLGSIRVFHGLLIVRNTLAVHQQLGGYLAENIAGP